MGDSFDNDITPKRTAANLQLTKLNEDSVVDESKDELSKSYKMADLPELEALEKCWRKRKDEISPWEYYDSYWNIFLEKKYQIY